MGGFAGQGKQLLAKANPDAKIEKVKTCLGHPKCVTQQVRRRGLVTRHASYCPLFDC